MLAWCKWLFIRFLVCSPSSTVPQYTLIRFASTSFQCYWMVLFVPSFYCHLHLYLQTQFLLLVVASTQVRRVLHLVVASSQVRRVLRLVVASSQVRRVLRLVVASSQVRRFLRLVVAYTLAYMLLSKILDPCVR